MRPIARPVPRDTPALWQRAKAMFGGLMEKARTVTQLALHWRLSRAERREILMRLRPVEKLTREFIISEAATFLLMTPEGMKLRREARIIALPVRAPPKPPPRQGPLITGSRRLAVFDPHTLAVLRPGEPAAAIKPNTHNSNIPTTRRCSFMVMHRAHPEDDDAAPTKKPGPRPRLFSYDDIVAFTPKSRPQSPERDEGPRAPIARRIEALSRALEKPDRAIRRIARFLASLPREALEPPDLIRVSTWGWYHGRAEFLAANDLAERAFIAFTRARIADCDAPREPG